MVGPFAHSLRAKLLSLVVLLVVAIASLGIFSARMVLQLADADASRVALALASDSNSRASRNVLVSSSNATLDGALAQDFGGSSGLILYGVVDTATGELIARSSPAIQQYSPSAWRTVLGDGQSREQRSKSCATIPVPAFVALTAPATNALWNILDSSTSCSGRAIRTSEVISIGRLPKGLSGRTIIPELDVYVDAALLLGGGLVSLVAILLLLLYVHRRVVKPLRTIRQGAVIMAQGKLDHHIRVKNRDEVGVIANFINEVGRNLLRVKSELMDRQRIASELDAAAKIQNQLLPSEVPQIPGLQIAARTRPSTEVGGDNFDFIQIDEENVLMFIGDVTGHGVPAGLVMIMVDVLIDAFSSMHRSPKEILTNVNRVLKPNIDSTMYMTMIMFNFNIKTQKLLYAAAGHEHIIHYHAATRRCTVTRAGGIALGMVPDMGKLVKEQEIPLQIGDVIVLYSDGVTEAYGGHDGKQMFGLDHLVDAVERSGHRDSQGIFDTATKMLADFMGLAPQNDDITLMVLKYVGASQSDIDKASKRIKLTITEGDKKGGKRWDWDKKPNADAPSKPKLVVNT